MPHDPDHRRDPRTPYYLRARASRGYIRALEYGVHALIARHHDPACLADLWAHVLPEVADQQAEMQDRPLLYPTLPSSRPWP